METECNAETSAAFRVSFLSFVVFYNYFNKRLRMYEITS